MPGFNFITERLLIIAKTYPELSSKYGETVCTAAVTTEGQPRRLYPVPFRYLEGDQKFDRYQWISAPISKNLLDQRPESFNVKAEAIELQEKIKPTADNWGKRAEYVFRNPCWSFDSVEALHAEQKNTGQSIAVVTPRSIQKVYIKERSDDDATSFDEKLTRLRSQSQIDRTQLNLFEQSMPPQMKNLNFLGRRICVDWNCSGP